MPTHRILASQTNDLLSDVFSRLITQMALADQQATEATQQARGEETVAEWKQIGILKSAKRKLNKEEKNKKSKNIREKIEKITSKRRRVVMTAIAVFQTYLEDMEEEGVDKKIFFPQIERFMLAFISKNIFLLKKEMKLAHYQAFYGEAAIKIEIDLNQRILLLEDYQRCYVLNERMRHFVITVQKNPLEHVLDWKALQQYREGLNTLQRQVGRSLWQEVAIERFGLSLSRFFAELQPSKRTPIASEVQRLHVKNNALAVFNNTSKDVYALDRILFYLNLAASVDLENQKELGTEVIERSLQVVGEYLKNTKDSPHISNELEETIKSLGIPYTRISKLRDGLSHSGLFLFSVREKFRQEKIEIFKGIQGGLKKMIPPFFKLLYRKELKQIKSLIAQVKFEGFLDTDVCSIELALSAIASLQSLDEIADKLQAVSGNLSISGDTALLAKQTLVDDIILNIKLKETQKKITEFEAIHLHDDDLSGKIRRINQTIQSEGMGLADFLQKNHVTPSKSCITSLSESETEDINHLPILAKEIVPFRGGYQLEVIFDDYFNGFIDSAKIILNDAKYQGFNEFNEFNRTVTAKKKLHQARSALLGFFEGEFSILTQQAYNQQVDLLKDGLASLTNADRRAIENGFPWKEGEKGSELKKVVAKVQDSYLQILNAIKGKEQAIDLREAFEKFLNSLNLNETVKVKLKTLPRDYVIKRFESIFLKKIQALREVAEYNKADSLKVETYKVANEMLLLDITNIWKSLVSIYTLSNPLAERFGPEVPLLVGIQPEMGFSLRNYLAHGDALFDALHPTFLTKLLDNIPKLLEDAELLIVLHQLLEDEDMHQYLLSVAKDQKIIPVFCVAANEIVMRRDLKQKYANELQRLRQSGRCKDYLTRLLTSVPTVSPTPSMATYNCTSAITHMMNSELQEAIAQGDLEKMEYCFASHLVGSTVKDKQGWNLAFFAAEGHQLDVIERLKRENVTWHEIDYAGGSAIHYLLLQDEEDIPAILDSLLKSDPNVLNAKNKEDFGALHFAAIKGNESACEALIKRGMHIKARTKNGWTPLLLAVQFAHSLLVDHLIIQLKASHQFNVEQDLLNQKEGLTGLLLATGNSDLEMLQVLLKHGVNINQTSTLEGGMAALHLAVFNNDEKAVQILCDNQADVNVNTHGQARITPLHVAAWKGYPIIADILLAQEKININAQDGQGKSPLSFAVANRWFEIVKKFLAKTGVDVNIQDNLGNTPLRQAVNVGDMRIFHLLLSQKNVQVNLKNFAGEAPLHIAVLKGNLPAVKTLHRKGADLSLRVQEDGCSALDIAAQQGNIEIMRYLVAEGANVLAESSQGSVLHQAVLSNNARVIRYLLIKIKEKSLTNYQKNTSPTDKEGNTPLMWAVKVKNLVALKELLDSKVDLHLKNNQGKTALDMILEEDYTQLIVDEKDLRRRQALIEQQKKMIDLLYASVYEQAIPQGSSSEQLQNDLAELINEFFVGYLADTPLESEKLVSLQNDLAEKGIAAVWPYIKDKVKARMVSAHDTFCYDAVSSQETPAFRDLMKMHAWTLLTPESLRRLHELVAMRALKTMEGKVTAYSVREPACAGVSRPRRIRRIINPDCLGVVEKEASYHPFLAFNEAEHQIATLLMAVAQTRKQRDEINRQLVDIYQIKEEAVSYQSQAEHEKLILFRKIVQALLEKKDSCLQEVADIRRAKLIRLSNREGQSVDLSVYTEIAENMSRLFIYCPKINGYSTLQFNIEVSLDEALTGCASLLFPKEATRSLNYQYYDLALAELPFLSRVKHTFIYLDLRSDREILANDHFNSIEGLSITEFCDMFLIDGKVPNIDQLHADIFRDPKLTITFRADKIVQFLESMTPERKQVLLSLLNRYELMPIVIPTVMRRRSPRTVSFNILSTIQQKPSHSVPFPRISTTGEVGDTYLRPFNWNGLLHLGTWFQGMLRKKKMGFIKGVETTSSLSRVESSLQAITIINKIKAAIQRGAKETKINYSTWVDNIDFIDLQSDLARCIEVNNFEKIALILQKVETALKAVSVKHSHLYEKLPLSMSDLEAELICLLKTRRYDSVPCLVKNAR